MALVPLPQLNNLQALLYPLAHMVPFFHPT